jgi:hypothetical protein
VAPEYVHWVEYQVLTGRSGMKKKVNEVTARRGAWAAARRQRSQTYV